MLHPVVMEHAGVHSDELNVELALLEAISPHPEFPGVSNVSHPTVNSNGPKSSPKRVAHSRSSRHGHAFIISPPPAAMPIP